MGVRTASSCPPHRRENSKGRSSKWANAAQCRTAKAAHPAPVGSPLSGQPLGMPWHGGVPGPSAGIDGKEFPNSFPPSERTDFREGGHMRAAWCASSKPAKRGSQEASQRSNKERRPRFVLRGLLAGPAISAVCSLVLRHYSLLILSVRAVGAARRTSASDLCASRTA
jgi:hypothetical protein